VNVLTESPASEASGEARQVATGARTLLSLAIDGENADDEGSVLTEI
jgi:hypothetical protein